MRGAVSAAGALGVRAAWVGAGRTPEPGLEAGPRAEVVRPAPEPDELRRAALVPVEALPAGHLLPRHLVHA